MLSCSLHHMLEVKDETKIVPIVITLARINYCFSNIYIRCNDASTNVKAYRFVLLGGGFASAL